MVPDISSAKSFSRVGSVWEFSGCSAAHFACKFPIPSFAKVSHSLSTLCLVDFIRSGKADTAWQIHSGVL